MTKRRHSISAIGIFLGTLLAQPHEGRAAYSWVGNADGISDIGTSSPLGGDGRSVFLETNWDDDLLAGLQAPANNLINNSSQVPAGIADDLLVINGSVAGGMSGAGTATAHLRTNGHAIVVSDPGSGLKMAGLPSSGARIESDGVSGGTRSTLSVLSGGFVTTQSLQDISGTLSGVNSRLFIMTNASNAGLDNSVLNFIGTDANSPTAYWTNIAAANLFTPANLARLTVSGAPGVWGSDPFTFESGDNLVATAHSDFNVSNYQPYMPWAYTTTTSGFELQAITVPEPGTIALLIPAAVLLGRVRRAGRHGRAAHA
jgi:hypothetical protein